MNTHLSRCARAWWPLVASLSFLLTNVSLVWFGGRAEAAEPLPVVVRVEEDWELVLSTPDAETTAPQITCVFSPVGQLDSLYATFELNHQSQPGFAPGGLHLQIWRDEMSLATHSAPGHQVLSTQGERVRWTQVMTLQDGTLTFEITGGDSVTWGQFGGQGNLRASLTTDLTSLNCYDPEVSVLNSGIGYASNRVHSLRLTGVRLVTSTGQVLQDPSVRHVYPRN